MNIIELIDFFKSSGKNVEITFDQKCIRSFEVIFTDGILNPIHHVEFDKCKVIEDGKDIYMKIKPHRQNCDMEYISKVIQKP